MPYTLRGEWIKSIFVKGSLTAKFVKVNTFDPVLLFWFYSKGITGTKMVDNSYSGGQHLEEKGRVEEY